MNFPFQLKISLKFDYHEKKCIGNGVLFMRDVNLLIGNCKILYFGSNLKLFDQMKIRHERICCIATFLQYIL